MANKRYVCINNSEHEVSLTKYKIYEAIDEERNLLRIIDDTDEDYLFPRERFVEPLEILHECSEDIDGQLQKLSSADFADDPDINWPPPENVQWLKEKLDTHWLPDMPIPFIFPMRMIYNAAMEWFIGYEEHGITINFNDHTGDWDWWDSKTDETGEETLDLNLDESWDKIKRRSVGIRP